MFKIRAKYYVGGLVSISLAILLYVYLTIYISIDNYNSNRIYNLRAVPGIYRVSLLEKFLDKQYVKNSILILGDSQPNGHMYPTKDIFSTLLSKKLDQPVINAAFQDESITDNLHTVGYAKTRDMQFNTIIFNINPAHANISGHHRLDLNNSVDYKIGILKYSKNFKEFSNKFNPKKDPGDVFWQYPSLDNYFYSDLSEFSLNIYLERVKKLIHISKTISKNVIIYETPHYHKDVKRLKVNELNFKKVNDNIKRICQENNVTFLKPDIKEKKYFKDVIHFNSKGHIEMSEILYNLIKRFPGL